MTSATLFGRIALMLAAAFSLPQIAQAQTAPCLGCAIARQESAASVRANQAIVQNALQNALNNQLQTQSNALQTQALLRSAQLNAQTAANAIELQQLLLLERLQLLQIRERELLKVKKAPPKPR